MIYGNSVSAANTGIGKTIVLVDEKGVELVGIITENAIVFDATPNDIRFGKVAATQNGITIGEKVIPSYNTNEGYKVIPSGSKFVLTMKNYDYTKLQAIFCPFNTSMANSVAADKVAIEGKVYPVQSTTATATIVKDSNMTQIDFGISNDTSTPYLIRYFMYKEIY